MSVGVILAAAALAQASDAPAATAPADPPASAYGPSTPAPPKSAASARPARKDCSLRSPDPQTGAIVVCVVKPNGYRIDPDILAAKKMKQEADQGRPRPPERYADNSCASIGPHGCGDMGINLLAAAMTAVQVAGRLSKGQDVASVFRTDPQLSEYQYYQLAKAEREKREAEENGDGYLAQVEAEGEAPSAGAK